MDTVTQAVLGAAVGQAFFSKPLKKRAIWWGAVGGTIPDLDVVVIPFMGPWGEFLYHRGPTHGLIFSVIAAPLIGYGIYRLHKRKFPLRTWILLFFAALFTHPLLDIFTTYGTQIFSPFSNVRVAFNGVAIIDPLYTICLLTALVFGMVFSKKPKLCGNLALGALLISTGYLFYGAHLNHKAEKMVRAQVKPHEEVKCYATLFQVFLRRAVVRDQDIVKVGFFSLLNPKPISWKSFPILEDPRIDAIRNTEKGQVFEWFADWQTAASIHPLENGGARVQIHDIRWGFNGPPDQGIWGIQGDFNSNGERISEITRFKTKIPKDKKTLKSFFSMVFNGQ